MSAERVKTAEKSLDIKATALEEGIYYSDEYPFPYEPEDFTEEEKQVLLRYFTNVDRPVYVIKNMDQEVAGALLSRFSRTKFTPREVFLREFYGDPAEGVRMIEEYLVEELGVGEDEAREKAGQLYQKTIEVGEFLEQKGLERKEGFFERVFAEFGDDSVIQMGGVHIIFEHVSQPAAKAIEDQRIAAGYIEKSTRYVEFDKEVSGRFLYMDVPELQGTEFEEEYDRWNRACFEGYTKSVPATKEAICRKYPLEEITIVDTTTGAEIGFVDIEDDEAKEKIRKAYEISIRAKTLDLVRAFLPSTTVTNIGAFFSGQAAEHALNKMISSPYKEVQLLGLMALEEAYKIAPSFLQNAPNVYGRRTREYMRELRKTQEQAAEAFSSQISPDRRGSKARLVDWDEDCDVRIATQIIYTAQGENFSKQAIFDWARRIKEEDLAENSQITYSPRLAQIIQKAIPSRKSPGRNRRHKLPRAFEHAFFEVEFNSNFGGYRDLQRNRISSTERQRLSAGEIDIPSEFRESGMEQVLGEYQRVANWTRELHRKLRESGNEDLVRAAEYVTILGNRMRYNVRANVRQWAFFSELRTIPGGHRDYRWIMQRAVRQILYVSPFLKPLFAHIDWKKDYGLGRLKAEIRSQEKLAGLERSSK